MNRNDKRHATTILTPAGQGNGITVNSGTFILNGVAIRANCGRGVWVPNDAVHGHIITGCRVTDNDVALSLRGRSYIVSNNVLEGNRVNFSCTDEEVSTAKDEEKRLQSINLEL